ncbi:MAG: tyrosine-type recombinase/integrase [Ferruginibacter sp.]
MITVLLNPFFHRGQQQMGICCRPDKVLNTLIRKIKGVRWSRTHTCWYLPLSRENYTTVTERLKNAALIDTEVLKQYLVAKNNAGPGIVKPTQNTIVTKVSLSNCPVPKQPKARPHQQQLSDANNQAMNDFNQHLILKAYSPSTIRTYSGELVQFLYAIKSEPATGFTVARIKDYLQYCFVTLKLSESTVHSRMNALKFYYEQVLGREKFFWEIPRPKKPLLLPNVLGEREITNLFNALTNIKHKAILFTAYSAGLRVSEAVGLRIKDIDSDRMQIKVAGAKGKKDRYVGLSPIVLDILRNYIKKINPRPVNYLFEGSATGVPYATRTAQKIFQRAKNIAGIRKDVSFHSLRHSFATHLLEKGIDIRFIKDLLGHFDIRTTERYTHVRKDTLINITSPLDDLWLKGDIL